MTAASYDLSNSDYNSCIGCIYITPDYKNNGNKIYFQKSGTIVINEYNPETYELKADISATLVEATVAEDGSITINEDEGAACIEITTGVVKAADRTDKTETCADIYDCMDTCPENDSECQDNCYGNSTAVARTQFNDLELCGEDHDCHGSYRCYYENCREQEAICGMAVDENYNIPYGSVTINGTFPYLHKDSKPVVVDPETGIAEETELPEEETKITLTNEYVIMGAFVRGTFGNNNTPVIDPAAEAGNKVFSYAQMSHFKAPNLTDKNITLVQTYQHEEGTNPTPTVHIVTTITQSREEPYTLGLGKWEEEARIFVKGTKSDGTPCDHAFGVGTISISNISYPSISDVVTGAATQIIVTGAADLYSYKATPDYGGDVSDNEWVACDPM